MKKIRLHILAATTILFGIGMNSTHGQQIPLGNLYTSNNYVLNPAYAGQDLCTQVYATHRRQWVGINNAPVTSYLSGSTYLGKNMGLGLRLYNDKASILSQTYGMLSFAYHLPVGETSKLSFGLSTGMFNNSIDMGAITANDMTDELFTGTNYKPTFETDFGLAFRSKKMNLGVSVPRFVETSAKFNTPIDQGVFTLKRHILGYGAYDLTMGRGTALTPSVMTRYAPGIDFQYDVNLDLNVQDKYGAGIGYREGEGIIARLGLTISEQFKMNYAYEFFTSGITAQSGGSHEIMIGIKLCKKVEPTPEEPIMLTVMEDEGEKSHEFKNLKAMDKYVLDLQEIDPILSQRIRAQMDAADPEMKQFKVDNTSYVVRVKGDEETKDFKFRTLDEITDHVLKLDKENPVLSDRIRKELKDDASIKLYNIDDRSIKLKLKTDDGTKEYEFRTLKEMDAFILKVAEGDPELAAKIRALVDADPDLKLYEVMAITQAETEDKPVIDKPVEEDQLTKEEVELLKKKIKFGLNYTNALNESKPILDKAVMIMKKHPNLKLEMDGYTCDLGSNTENQKLSQQRAEYVANYFIKKGISKDRIRIKGLGESKPIQPNDTDQHRSENRRVEFKIIEE